MRALSTIVIMRDQSWPWLTIPAGYKDNNLSHYNALYITSHKYSCLYDVTLLTTWKVFESPCIQIKWINPITLVILTSERKRGDGSSDWLTRGSFRRLGQISKANDIASSAVAVIAKYVIKEKLRHWRLTFIQVENIEINVSTWSKDQWSQTEHWIPRDFLF